MQEARVQRDGILDLYRARHAPCTVRIEFPTGEVLTTSVEGRAVPARQPLARATGSGVQQDGIAMVGKGCAFAAVVVAAFLVIAVVTADGSSSSDPYMPSPSSGSTQRPDSRLAPEDDLDGDGWVDDPCPDKNIPLYAEC
ncbi:hypothetical protein [Streptomyces spororaveus]|uniref:hypothetical protein n=1 Tax=Streptomyces spororaveus TaxID=284039 RepID=UPI0037B8267A